MRPVTSVRKKHEARNTNSNMRLNTYQPKLKINRQNNLH